MASLFDLALAPARIVFGALEALPRLADSVERLSTVGDALARIADFDEQLALIASYGASLEQLATLTDSLARLVESTQGLGALADAVHQLERAAADLTSTVQPLQGVAQRLNRFGRKDAPTPPDAIPLSSG